MPFIKLVEPGFEKFTGKLSRVQFENGVSVEPMPVRDAERLGNNMRIVELETGEPISHTHYMAQSAGLSVSNLGVQMPEFVKIQPEEQAPQVVDTAQTAQTVQEQPEKVLKQNGEPEKTDIPAMNYTIEFLEKIVDTGGVKGIREYAKQYGVNGRSVSEIINTLISMKERAERKAALAQIKS